VKQFLLLLLIPLTANAWTRTSDQQIGARAAQLAPRDLRLIIYRFQTQYTAGIAHIVGDANNPWHVATDEELESSHADFEHYFERRMERFPTVFYGLDPRFALPQYLDRMLHRTANFAPLMSEEYFRGGSRHTSSDFDDRSTAFGVASICYSHAITDIVNVDYYIWREAGGDVRSAASMRSARVIANAN
jgi:hypothetical protein